MGAANVSAGTAITVEFVCLGISLLFLLLRLYARIHVLSTFTTPDLLILISWLFFFGCCIVDQLSSVKYGLWNPGIRYDGKTFPKFENYITDPTLLEAGLKLRYGTIPFYYFVVYGIKASFLVMYHGMIPRDMVKLRGAMWVTVGIVAVGLCLMLGLNLGWCQPISRNWALTSDERCLSWAQPGAYFIVNIVNVITDLLVYILPFFLLPRLRNFATRSQILGIVGIFSLGALCIICTLGKLVAIGTEASNTLAACWYAAEMATAVIVACCPTLKYVIHKPGTVVHSTITFRNRRNEDPEARHAAVLGRGNKGSGMIIKTKAMLNIKAVVGRVKESLSPRNGSFPRSPRDAAEGEGVMLASAASSIRSPSRAANLSPPHENDPRMPPHTFYNNSNSCTIITTTERPQTGDNEFYLPKENRDLVLNGLAPRRKSQRLTRGTDEIPFTPTVDTSQFDKFLLAKRMSAQSRITNRSSTMTQRPLTAPLEHLPTVEAKRPSLSSAKTTSPTTPPTAPPPEPATTVVSSPTSSTEAKKTRKRAFTGGQLSPTSLEPPARPTSNGLLVREANEVPFTPTVTIDLSGELKKATRRVFTGALLAPSAIKKPGSLSLPKKRSNNALAVSADSTRAQPFTPQVDSVGLDKFVLGMQTTKEPEPERRKSTPAAPPPPIPETKELPPHLRLSTHSVPVDVAMGRRSTSSTASNKDAQEQRRISTPLSTPTAPENEIFSSRHAHLTVPGTPDTPATPDTGLLFAPFTPMSDTHEPPPTPSDFPSKPSSLNSSPESKRSETKRTAESDNTLGIWGQWRRNSGATTVSASTPMADGFPSNYHSPNTPTVIPHALARKGSTKSSRKNSKTELGVLTFGGDETEDVIMQEAFGAPTPTRNDRGEYRLSSGPPPIPERKPGSATVTSGMVPAPTMASVAARHSNGSALRRKASTRSAKLAAAAAAVAQRKQQKDMPATPPPPFPPSGGPSGTVSVAGLAKALKDAYAQPDSFGSSIFGTSV